MKVKHCECPDRHEPKLACGYPMPCPHHTPECARKLRVLAVINDEGKRRKLERKLKKNSKKLEQIAKEVRALEQKLEKIKKKRRRA